MNTSISSYLSALTLGEPLIFENITVVPLFSSKNGELDFYTLNEAIKQEGFNISEVSLAGSVPYLSVQNFTDKPVILIEGEEIIGLKQNRILNTTVIVKEKTATKIPVSCCEAGRWSYRSSDYPINDRKRFSEIRDFPNETSLSSEPTASGSESSNQMKEDDIRNKIDSEAVISVGLRAKKVSSVTHCLRLNNTYNSDQGLVWDEINKIHRKVGVSSPTRAVQDSFKKVRKSLDEYQKAFPLAENQKGILVLINGKAVGCEFFCSHRLFSKLYNKIMNSYTFDAYMRKTNGDFKVEPLQVAKDFLGNILELNEIKQVDLGDTRDFRFENEEITGFALVYDEKLVHSAFFSKKYEV